jgi:hypothetical protein
MNYESIISLWFFVLPAVYHNNADKFQKKIVSLTAITDDVSLSTSIRTFAKADYYCIGIRVTAAEKDRRRISTILKQIQKMLEAER